MSGLGKRERLLNPQIDTRLSKFKQHHSNLIIKNISEQDFKQQYILINDQEPFGSLNTTFLKSENRPISKI
jgi:hypothetical protein